jgi:hypothetical protein
MKKLLRFSAGMGMCLAASVAGGQNTVPAPAAQPVGITQTQDSVKPIGLSTVGTVMMWLWK